MALKDFKQTFEEGVFQDPRSMNPSDLAIQLQKEKQSDKLKAECEAKGGTWDAINKICNMPKKTQEIKPVTPEIFRDEKGIVSGVILPTGQSFQGISPKDVQGLVSGFQENAALPQGTQPAGTTQAQVERQQRIQELISLGERGLLAPADLQALQEAPIDIGQALTAGTLGNLPSVISRTAAGAGIGAAGGAIAGVGIGAVPGAIIGGAAGLISAIYGGTASNIKRQQAGEISKSRNVLTAARTNMKALALIAAKDPNRAEDAIILYYQQLAQVQRAHRQVQLETQGNLNKFMEDGTEVLSDFDLFLQPGGYADLQLARLQQSIASKQPASDAEILSFYEEEFLNNE